MQKKAVNTAAESAGKPTIELLTTDDLCRELQTSRFTIHRRCKEGVLPYVKNGNQKRFRRADILAFIEANSSQPKAS